MADLDDDATPELSFTYQVSDEVVQEALAVGRELRQTRELEETLMAHTAAAVARLAREGEADGVRRHTKDPVIIVLPTTVSRPWC